VTFYTFNYILDNSESFLKNIYHSKKDNSLIILDLFYPKTLKEQIIENKWANKRFKSNNDIIK